MHPPTPTCSGLCVLPPACAHPQLAAPRCPASCPRPLAERAIAGDILIHLAEHTPGVFTFGCRIASENVEVCGEFVRAELPCRFASPEADLLALSLRWFALQPALRWLRGASGAIDFRDAEQAALLLFGEKLKDYDPARGSIYTWTKPWFRHSAQVLIGRFGSAFSRDAKAAVYLALFQEAIARRESPPRSDLEWATLLSPICLKNVGRDRARGYVRMLDRPLCIEELSPEVADSAVAIDSSPASMSEDELVEVLSRENVREALQYLTPNQRRKIIELIGLDGCTPKTQVQLARLLGISTVAVRRSLRRSSRRIQNTGAMAYLDPDVLADGNDLAPNRETADDQDGNSGPLMVRKQRPFAQPYRRQPVSTLAAAAGGGAAPELAAENQAKLTPTQGATSSPTRERR